MIKKVLSITIFNYRCVVFTKVRFLVIIIIIVIINNITEHHIVIKKGIWFSWSSFDVDQSFFFNFFGLCLSVLNIEKKHSKKLIIIIHRTSVNTNVSYKFRFITTDDDDDDDDMFGQSSLMTRMRFASFFDCSYCCWIHNLHLYIDQYFLI